VEARSIYSLTTNIVVHQIITDIFISPQYYSRLT